MADFRFKQFCVDDRGCGMKVGTDSVLLGAWARCSDAHSVIDLGAGSGLLSLMVAQRSADSVICAVEIDDGACLAAAANFAASPWASRLSVVHTDALVHTPAIKPDLIICNPPYFVNGIESPDCSRAIARHGVGLSPFSALDYAKAHLSANGILAMVSPADIADDILYAAEMRRFDLCRRCDVRTSVKKSPTRVLWEFAPKEQNSSVEPTTQITIGDQTYVSLTRNFYLFID